MTQGAIVNARAPGFSLPCTSGSIATRRMVKLEDFRDRWLTLLFYPRDFGLV